MTPNPALLDELLADPAEQSPALLRLIGDPDVDVDVRRAAISGLGRSGLSALVLQPALLADEEPVALHAWRTVAGLADAAELGVLETLPDHPSATVAAQARFGLATVAHRHGIAGYELPPAGRPRSTEPPRPTERPRSTEPPRPSQPPASSRPDRDDHGSMPVRLAPAPPAARTALARLEPAELHGIPPARSAVWRGTCPRGEALLALDRGLLADGGDRLAAAPRLLGLVGAALDGRPLAVRLLVLSSPADSGRFDVVLCRRDGRVAGGGRCSRAAVAQLWAASSPEPEPEPAPPARSSPPRSSRALRSHSAILWPPWPIVSPASRNASLNRSV